MPKYPAHPARIFSRPATTLPSESTNRCPSVINSARASTLCPLIARTNASATAFADLFMPPLYPRRPISQRMNRDLGLTYLYGPLRIHHDSDPHSRRGG